MCILSASCRVECLVFGPRLYILLVMPDEPYCSVDTFMADGPIARLPRAWTAEKGLRDIQKIDSRLWLCSVEGFMHKAPLLRLG
jgi:hypothetical protein